MAAGPEQEAREAIRAIAEELDLTVAFARGRRSSDYFFVRLMGERTRVLEVPVYLLNHCPEVDVEVLSARYVDYLYRMSLAVTTKLEAQSPHRLERRAKLRRLEEAFFDKPPDE